MPIPLDHIHFPYYGQTLFDLADGASAAAAADVIVRGRGGDDAEEQFVRAALEEAAARENITDDDVDAVLDGDDPVIERGAGNWKVTRVLASLLDRRVPGASGSTVALVTSDVYKYPRNPGISRLIDEASGKDSRRITRWWSSRIRSERSSRIRCSSAPGPRRAGRCACSQRWAHPWRSP